MSSLSTVFTNIANAIREKGISQVMTPLEMPAMISSIPSSGSRYGSTLSTFYNCDSTGKLIQPTEPTDLNFAGVTDIDANVFSSKFRYNAGIRKAFFPDLSIVTGNTACPYLFGSATGLQEVNMSSLVEIKGNGVFSNAFSGCTSLSSVNFRNLTTIGTSAGNTFAAAFENCKKLGSISFPKLSSINSTQTFNNGFKSCTSLTDVCLSSVEEITGTNGMQLAFSGCTSLRSVDFSSLKRLGTSETGKYINGMFQGCTSLLSARFPELTSITAGTVVANATFGTMQYVKDIYFDKLSAIPNTYLFNTACTALTAIHFSKSVSSDISSCAGYNVKWGAPNVNCEILCDIGD